MSFPSQAASGSDVTQAQTVSGHSHRAALSTQSPEILAFTLFQTLHIFLFHPKASNSIYFHSKGTSWSCILYPAFSQPQSFSSPWGSPSQTNFASPGRRARVSPAALQTACVFYRLFFWSIIWTRDGTQVHITWWHHHVCFFYFLLLISTCICFWPLLPYLQGAQDLPPMRSGSLQHAEQELRCPWQVICLYHYLDLMQVGWI